MRRVMAGILAVVSSIGTAAWAQTSAPAAPAEAAPAAAPAPAPTPPKTWADSVTVKGDVRLRHEEINDDSKKDSDGETYTQRRERIRARLGAEAKVNDKTKAGIELSTGGKDPVSGNQSLGNGFDKEEIRLSLGYIDYTLSPKDSPNTLNAIGGKMKNPFITMNDDLVWDGDLTPEGAAVRGQYGLGMATLYGNGGYFAVQERSSQQDTSLYAGQAAAKFEFSPAVNLTLGASYYAYQNMEGFDVLDWESKNNSFGNSTQAGSVSGSTTNKAYKTDFTPFVAFAALEVWLLGRPLTFFGQDLTNVDADDFDHGQLYGVSYGRAKLPQSWELGYSYAELEKDATVGAFTDSDRWGGGTDGEGHKLYAKYQLMKNLQAGVTYFVDTKKISDPAKETDYDRLQLDLVASF